MLEVKNLSFDYQEQPLLNQVHFSMSNGGLLHLRGANGTGKSTLLKLIAGLYHPAQGSISFAGQNILDDLSAYHRQVCFIGHKPGINPNLSLRENCFFDLHSPIFRGQNRPNIEELAALFNLESYLDFPCGILSAGQKRRCALMRLWLSEAPLWLLDEPLVALDELALKLIINKIKIHRQQGGSIILTSHQDISLALGEYQEYCL